MRLARATCVALGAMTLLAACGGGGTPSAVVSGTAPTFVASASATGDVLFAVLERKPGERAADTVAIVGLDGYARVKARFTPVAVPQIGNAATILPAEAQVAAGSVFYVDRHGVVRALTPGRSDPETVTTFPAGGAQQEVGFAVDPGGRHLEATVLTLPPLLPPSPPDCPICRSFGDQTARVDVEIADRGGRAHTIRTVQTRGEAISTRLDVVAWDLRGPVAALDQVLGAQYAVPGWDAHIAHLDAAGRPGPRLGGGCKVAMEARNGTVICNTAADGAEVRDATGRVLLSSIGLYGVLSDDGTRVGYNGRAGVIGRSLVRLPKDFSPEGFVGDDVVVGSTDFPGNYDELAYVRLSNPTRVVDLGFKGLFVGAL